MTRNFEQKNGQWKGDNVGYGAVHAWIRRRLPQPLECEGCGAENKYLDLANISGECLRRLDDWEYLCRRCHMLSDGRMKNLLQNSHKRKIKSCVVCEKPTTKTKYCEACAKEERRKWWKRYNKTTKRMAWLAKQKKLA